jgi:hypothetical protein
MLLRPTGGHLGGGRTLPKTPKPCPEAPEAEARPVSLRHLEVPRKNDGLLLLLQAQAVQLRSDGRLRGGRGPVHGLRSNWGRANGVGEARAGGLGLPLEAAARSWRPGEE